MKNKIKGYTCPYCSKKQKTIIEWQICSVGYERIADDTNDYLDSTPEIVGGDFESYSCPNCKEELPMDII